MADSSSRIDDLRRRVQKDPASIAFAQLAEELRRARRFDESIEACRAGLEIHPGYLSARVTLGRALVEVGQLGDAQAELEHVLASAPENLAAIRGLAEINHRNGDLAAALSHYRAALALARNDPDLQETVTDLAKRIEPPAPPAEDGLSLEQMARELSQHRPPRPVDAPIPAVESSDSTPPEWMEPLADAAAAAEGDAADSSPDPHDPHATRVIAALEHWLEAIHVTRDQRGA
jgi:tetratricopeptide (TPR) repeat protein